MNKAKYDFEIGERVKIATSMGIKYGIVISKTQNEDGQGLYDVETSGGIYRKVIEYRCGEVKKYEMEIKS